MISVAEAGGDVDGFVQKVSCQATAFTLPPPVSPPSSAPLLSAPRRMHSCVYVLIFLEFLSLFSLWYSSHSTFFWSSCKPVPLHLPLLLFLILSYYVGLYNFRSYLPFVPCPVASTPACLCSRSLLLFLLLPSSYNTPQPAVGGISTLELRERRGGRRGGRKAADRSGQRVSDRFHYDVHLITSIRFSGLFVRQLNMNRIYYSHTHSIIYRPIYARMSMFFHICLLCAYGVSEYI